MLHNPWAEMGEGAGRPSERICPDADTNLKFSVDQICGHSAYRESIQKSESRKSRCNVADVTINFRADTARAKQNLSQLEREVQNLRQRLGETSASARQAASGVDVLAIKRNGQQGKCAR